MPCPIQLFAWGAGGCGARPRLLLRRECKDAALSLPQHRLLLLCCSGACCGFILSVCSPAQCEFGEIKFQLSFCFASQGRVRMWH